MNVDLLIHSAAQLLTIASGGRPKRGAAMRELGIVEDGAVAVQGSRSSPWGLRRSCAGASRPRGRSTPVGAS